MLPDPQQSPTKVSLGLFTTSKSAKDSPSIWTQSSARSIFSPSQSDETTKLLTMCSQLRNELQSESFWGQLELLSIAEAYGNEENSTKFTLKDYDYTVYQGIEGQILCISKDDKSFLSFGEQVPLFHLKRDKGIPHVWFQLAKDEFQTKILLNNRPVSQASKKSLVTGDRITVGSMIMVFSHRPDSQVFNSHREPQPQFSLFEKDESPKLKEPSPPPLSLGKRVPSGRNDYWEPEDFSIGYDQPKLGEILPVTEKNWEIKANSDPRFFENKSLGLFIGLPKKPFARGGHLFCSICRSLVKGCVSITNCGHNFCKNCLPESTNRCPYCYKVVAGLTQSAKIDESVDSFLKGLDKEIMPAQDPRTYYCNDDICSVCEVVSDARQTIFTRMPIKCHVKPIVDWIHADHGNTIEQIKAAHKLLQIDVDSLRAYSATHQGSLDRACINTVKNAFATAESTFEFLYSRDFYANLQTQEFSRTLTNSSTVCRDCWLNFYFQILVLLGESSYDKDVGFCQFRLELLRNRIQTQESILRPINLGATDIPDFPQRGEVAPFKMEPRLQKCPKGVTCSNDNEYHLYSHWHLCPCSI